MPIGIRTAFLTTADVAVTSSAALVTTGLTSPIAAGQTQHIKAYLPVSVGATGGIRLQVAVPAGGVIFVMSFRLQNTIAPATVVAQQVASAAFTNALANAGNHWCVIEGTIVNGATAGNVDVQIAQNTVDILTLTLLRGAFLNVIKL